MHKSENASVLWALDKIILEKWKLFVVFKHLTLNECHNNILDKIYVRTAFANTFYIRISTGILNQNWISLEYETVKEIYTMESGAYTIFFALHTVFAEHVLAFHICRFRNFARTAFICFIFVELFTLWNSVLDAHCSVLHSTMQCNRLNTQRSRKEHT